MRAENQSSPPAPDDFPHRESKFPEPLLRSSPTFSEQMACTWGRYYCQEASISKAQLYSD